MEKIKKWFYKPKFTLLCYLLAILLLGYALFTMNNSYDYINTLVLQGGISWGSDLIDIISYFIGNSVNYLFYAFSFMFFGKVINLLNPKQTNEETIEDEKIEDKNEDKIIENANNNDINEDSKEVKQNIENKAEEKMEDQDSDNKNEEKLED